MNNLSKEQSNSVIAGLLSNTRLVALDVDGVLTDGSRLYDENGNRFLAFDVRDGLGIFLAKKAGMQVAFISSGQSEIVSLRAEELAVDHLVQGINDKKKAINMLRAQLDIAISEIVYVGDDLWDLLAFEESGVKIAVRDAQEIVKQSADLVTKAKGGHGAVREVINMILRAKNIDMRELL